MHSAMPEAGRSARGADRVHCPPEASREHDSKKPPPVRRRALRYAAFPRGSQRKRLARWLLHQQRRFALRAQQGLTVLARVLGRKLSPARAPQRRTVTHPESRGLPAAGRPAGRRLPRSSPGRRLPPRRPRACCPRSGRHAGSKPLRSRAPHSWPGRPGRGCGPRARAARPPAAGV